MSYIKLQSPSGDLSALWVKLRPLTWQASFPPTVKPAHSMLSVICPSKDSLRLHCSVETMGSRTVRSVSGICPPPALVYPHPDTRHTRPAAKEAPCRGSRATDT